MINRISRPSILHAGFTFGPPPFHIRICPCYRSCTVDPLEDSRLEDGLFMQRVRSNAAGALTESAGLGNPPLSQRMSHMWHRNALISRIEVTWHA